ncbi:MAG: lysyl oxidase family protein [bacterium]|nr:lysyl oxidase family protein [bacterium]
MRYSRLLLILTVPAILFTAYNITAEKLGSYEGELLPDLVPLPARDLTIERSADGKIFLLFSTTFYNQGRGPLELSGDPATKDIEGDLDRVVFQRVYHTNGGRSERAAGIFLWHQEHSHYHFSDFAEYDLEAVDAENHEDLAGSRVKSTFCIRDVSKIDLELRYGRMEAYYLTCNKDIQGVSVGWADTYYFNYPAQKIEITDLSSGTYQFVQKVNPALRLRELDYENNMSSVLFVLNMEKGTVQVLEETPSNTPQVEHIHLEQPFGEESL